MTNLNREAMEKLDTTAAKQAHEDYVRAYLANGPSAIIQAGGAAMVSQLAGTAMIAMGPPNSPVRKAFNALIREMDIDYHAYKMATDD